MKDPFIKIFVILGTQKFPFDRLLIALDELVEKGFYTSDEILVQVKALNYKPKHLNCIETIPLEQFEKLIEKAELVITHAGEYSIMTNLRYEKNFLIVPRLSLYGEHVDNNQLEISTVMENKLNVLVVKDMRNLHEMIEKAKTHIYEKWVFNNNRLIESIRTKII